MLEKCSNKTVLVCAGIPDAIILAVCVIFKCDYEWDRKQLKIRVEARTNMNKK